MAGVARCRRSDGDAYREHSVCLLMVNETSEGEKGNCMSTCDICGAQKKKGRKNDEDTGRLRPSMSNHHTAQHQGCSNSSQPFSVVARRGGWRLLNKAP